MFGAAKALSDRALLVRRQWFAASLHATRKRTALAAIPKIILRIRIEFGLTIFPDPLDPFANAVIDVLFQVLANALQHRAPITNTLATF